MSGKIRNPARRCKICGGKCKRRMRYCKLCDRERKREQADAEKYKAAQKEWGPLIDELPALTFKASRKSPIVEAFGFGVCMGAKYAGEA